MLNYNEIKSNHEIIKEFCKNYRKELTIAGGVVGENMEKVTYSDYVKIMNELSFEEFTGNYLIGLLNNDAIEVYKKILNNEMTFDEYVKEELEYIYEDYKEKVNS